MPFSIYGKSHEVIWTNVGLLTFAIIFFVAGASRIVEFEDLSFTKLTKFALVTIHLLGTLCFSISLVLLGVQIDPEDKIYSSAIFAFAIFSLFPLHVFLAVKRKIRDSNRAKKL